MDMQRLFKLYPETQKAKENFEELVRQAEEQVDLRKAEVLRLRHELSDLKAERELLAKTPMLITPAEAPKAPPALPGYSAPASTAAAPSKTGTAPASPTPRSPNPTAPSSAAGSPTAPASAATISTAAARTPLVINIPGVSTAPITVLPPAEPPKPPAVVVSTAPSQALVEQEAKIALKTRDLAQKEEDFKSYQAAAEKSLLDIESRKTEILLGKLHKAVQVVARKEGISVVVDKSSIVYGHDGVDLTDKVLKYLKGS